MQHRSSKDVGCVWNLKNCGSGLDEQANTWFKVNMIIRRSKCLYS